MTTPTPETPAGGLAAVKTLIRDLGDMACIGCRANTCPACALAAEITGQVHVIAQARACIVDGDADAV